ncbi:MAG: Hsp20/alpha crystallin family protein [Minisyncoccia bacterium]
MAFRFFKSKEENEEKKIDIKNHLETEENDDVLEGEGQLMVDVYQTPSEIVIKSAVAGVKPEDIDISIVNDMITIKGKRELDEVVKSDDYFYQECYWGSFSRSIILPIEIDADRVNATLKNGILTIRLPKIDKNKVKKVKIKSE